MPSFISNKGVWYAAKENVGGLIYKGEKDIAKKDLPKTIIFAGEVLKTGMAFIYNGADREALKMLHMDGYDMKGERVMGHDFRKDTEFLQAIRSMNFNSVEEYLKHIGYDEAADEERFKETASKTMSHEVAEKVNEIKVLAGGRNTAGEGDLIGGFGEERERPASELKTTKQQ